jgi:hypothetical protein
MFLQATTKPEPDAPLTESAKPPLAALFLLFGKHLAYSVSAIARLGVADHMGDSPVDVETLARKVGANASALSRVMRVLAGAGVFEQTPEGSFRLTKTGELLRTDAPGSCRYTAIQMGDAWSTRPWEHFTDTIRTGIDGVRQAFGKNLFELLAEEPEQADHFNRSMNGYSAAVTKPIVRAYDFRSIKRLADVGGGHGKLLAAILKEYPQMTGVVYDLPEVTAGAPGQEHLADCRDRIQFESGSFFERVPSGCDAYMMKFILHDWSDEHCKTILRCIRQQLPDHGRVLVIEQLVTETAELSLASLLDIEMLALTVGGRERTEAEFQELFASADLRLTRVIPTDSPLYILEARPA